MSVNYPAGISFIPAPFYVVGNTWRPLLLRSHVGLKNVGNWIAREVGAMPNVNNGAGASGSGVKARQMHRDRLQCFVYSMSGWHGVHWEGNSSGSVLPEILIHF